jgi:tricorn protease
MLRRTVLAALGASILVLAFAAHTRTAAPVRLARHPDYSAGRVVFSYLGDIWLAREDGTASRRLTDHRARDVYPRFSPDGRFVAFSSNRYGNYDVFVVAADGGTPRRLTYHSGTDDVIGWSRDSQPVRFRSGRGEGAVTDGATM